MEYHNRYQFMVKEFTNLKENNKVIVICIFDKEKNIVIPHPITEFISSTYFVRNISLNTLLVPARNITRFLNFILLNINAKNEIFMNLSIKGLKGLTLQHGSVFLSHLTQQNLERQTVSQYESSLIKFYKYLKDYDYIDIPIEKREFDDKSLFRDMKLQTQYPPRINRHKTHKLKDFGKNRYELMNLFISISQRVYPEVAFAVCLQFFGGLRKGELVNLTYDNLHVETLSSMSVQIQDNRDILFSRLKDTSNEFPKRVNYLPPHLCKQIILNTPILWECYKIHLRLNPKKSSTQPVFKDKFNNAMTGQVYDNRFKKIINLFLKELKVQGRYEDYITLSETKWGTHIGRGIFTNILFDMNLTPTQIAIARGDSNINSSLDYVDDKITYNAILENLDQLSKLKL